MKEQVETIFDEEQDESSSRMSVCVKLLSMFGILIFPSLKITRSTDQRSRFTISRKFLLKVEMKRLNP